MMGSLSGVPLTSPTFVAEVDPTHRTDALTSSAFLAPGMSEVPQTYLDGLDADRRPLGDHGRLGAARRAELAQDRRDVDARGLDADEQPLADLTVREALRDQLED